MNEVVKYHNDMNSVAFRGFGKVELDLFFAICSKMRDEGKNEVEFTFHQIRSLSQFKKTSKEAFVTKLKSTYEKLLALIFKEEKGSRTTYFTLFDEFTIDTAEETISITIKEKYFYILNGLTANFTRFELAEFVSLKSSYSKGLYRLLKQFRATGYYEVPMDDFRRLLDVPKSYRMSDINKTILTPALTELSDIFPELQCEKIKRAVPGSRGISVVKLIFSFKPTSKKDSILLYDYTK